MEKSTIKKLIEFTAGSCATFAAEAILKRFMPDNGLSKKIMFSIGSALIAAVVGDKVSKSSTVTEMSDVIANSFGTSNNDISKESNNEEAKEEATDEVSWDTSKIRNCFDDEAVEETTNEVKEEKVTEETSTEETTKPVMLNFVKPMENLYSGVEILLTFLTSKRLIKFFKIKKPLSAIATVIFTYWFIAWIMAFARADIYYGKNSNKEAIA